MPLYSAKPAAVAPKQRLFFKFQSNEINTSLRQTDSDVARLGQDVTAFPSGSRDKTKKGAGDGARAGCMVGTHRRGGLVKRWIRRVGIGIAAILVVAGATLVVAAQLGERKMQRRSAV